MKQFVYSVVGFAGYLAGYLVGFYKYMYKLTKALLDAKFEKES